MRSLILPLLTGFVALPLAGQQVLILEPPGWQSPAWRPVIVLAMADLDLTVKAPNEGQKKPPLKRGKVPGATVDVVGLGDLSSEHYLYRVLPKLYREVQQAFRMGQASSETSQILAQFMFAEPGKFIAQPASVWYNSTMPESLRWEGMWVVGASGGGSLIGPMGASKTQTLMSRGNNR